MTAWEGRPSCDTLIHEVGGLWLQWGWQSLPCLWNQYELDAVNPRHPLPVGTLAIGAWAGTRIKDTSDFAVAGHRLPLIMVITTSFATWFGAETVMGIPATFVNGGLRDVVEDPFGASMCLVLVGLFFAPKLYRMNLLTIGDYYRNRYGVPIEILCSILIILSYLGWVAAQITALGSSSPSCQRTNLSASGHDHRHRTGADLCHHGWYVGGGLHRLHSDDRAGDWFELYRVGVGGVGWWSRQGICCSQRTVAVHHSARDQFSWLGLLHSAAITMMLGSVPQQDVFQRVMSAKDAPTARNGRLSAGSATWLSLLCPCSLSLRVY